MTNLTTPNYGSNRTITKVIDTSLPADSQVHTVQSVLDPLSDAELAGLRAAVSAANSTGAARFRCADCNEPLSLPQHPASPTVPRDGRGAYFKHVFVEAAPACPVRTRGGVYDVGAVQYGGQQEGFDHQSLKAALADCLHHDPRFSDVQIEQRITALDGSYRVPDVSALFNGKRVTYDLQLATLPIGTIQDRDNFYRANGCHHIWLTDTEDLSRLSHQAFCDLHLTRGGRIFAIDDASIAASISGQFLQLEELRIVPRIASQLAIHNIWETQLVGVEVIMLDPQRRKIEGERQYQQTLLDQVREAFGPERRVLRQAAANNQSLQMSWPEWQRIANAICGQGIDTATGHQVGVALAFLAQVEIFVSSLPENRPAAAQELQRRLTALLSSRHALHWAPLVVQVGKIFPAIAQATTPEKASHLNALLTSPDAVKPILRYHTGMLCVLFPFLGFRLLAKAPKFQPNLRLSASRA